MLSYIFPLQVSPYYRAKLCGLCGNYNGQRHDGATTTAGCYYRDEKEYAYSYTVPSDTCATPRPEPVCPSEGTFFSKSFSLNATSFPFFPLLLEERRRIPKCEIFKEELLLDFPAFRYHINVLFLKMQQRIEKFLYAVCTIKYRLKRNDLSGNYYHIQYLKFSNLLNFIKVISQQRIQNKT